MAQAISLPNALRIAHGHIVPQRPLILDYYSKEILCYDDQKGVYVPAESYLRRALDQCLLMLGNFIPTDRVYSDFLNLIRFSARTQIEVGWERPPLTQINVRNGILDLAPLLEPVPGPPVLTPHTPEWKSTVQLPVVYNPEATCPKWEQFARDVFVPDSHLMPFWLAAWFMTPNVRDQRAALFVGTGSNGKTTMLNALKAWIGETNFVSMSLQELESNRFQRGAIRGKLVNFCDDLPKTKLEDSAVFKSLTGNGTIRAEVKFGDSYEFVSFARLFFLTNNVPLSKDINDAYLRRWYPVPLLAKFNSSRSMDDILAGMTAPDELSGVLNKVLTVWPAIHRDGLPTPESVSQFLDQLYLDYSPTMLWMREEVRYAPGEVVTPDHLWQSFCQRFPNPADRPINARQVLLNDIPSLAARAHALSDKFAIHTDTHWLFNHDSGRVWKGQVWRNLALVTPITSGGQPDYEREHFAPTEDQPLPAKRHKSRPIIPDSIRAKPH